ncbi:MAG: ATP-binding protein [Ardenticatenaceae bacterium]
MATFKARARAVDMLGRQQIAGVPNAISELFKNAHDAYADRVEVDYFGSDGLFVLRDDGLGMTKEDFEERWLTLGTESKLQHSHSQLPPPPIDPNKTPRPITGEKGIGRLSIAVIGPQVLVLSRAKRDGELSDLVAAFIHWGMFELPGINLDQIQIPVRVFANGTLPNEADVTEMVDVVRQNALNMPHVDPMATKRLLNELDLFDIDLLELSHFLGAPSLSGEGHGTHFYILPATETLAEDMAIDVQGDKTSRLKKLLLGFSNSMTPEHKPAPIDTAFRYWATDDHHIDIIGQGEFFTPSEFTSADHHIEGQFDEFGQFQGRVSIYNEKPVEHIVSWPKSSGKPTHCGPFKINVAHVQELARESGLPPEEFTRLTRKLARIGGLYIYRDGIRVLPYGDVDFDFLEIEKRRTVGAGYYFFSYRRMFGVIEITREQNSKLAEKAGREGFQENKAYREFKDILINFFIQIAADFFRQGGRESVLYARRKSELVHEELARQEREKQSQEKRLAFERRLNQLFLRLNKKEPQKQATALVDSLEKRLARLSAQDDLTHFGEQILKAEVEAARKLEELRDSYELSKPPGIGLPQNLNREWEAYRSELARVEGDVFAATERRIFEITMQVREELSVVVDQRQRIKRLLEEVVSSSQGVVNKSVKETRKELKATQSRIGSLTKQVAQEIQNTVEQIETELTQLDLGQMNSQEIEETRHQWESQISVQAKKEQELFEHVGKQLASINWVRDEQGYLISSADMTAALESEVLVLRERYEADLELTQLGMAIEIISHEFNDSIRSIRHGLKRLKRWADVNPGLKGLYRDIRASFEHLDGYLTMFTPLYRRLYRSQVRIPGNEIAKYLQNIFQERLHKHKITLIVSSAFKKKEIVGYPSTFYPIFVNLVDNAIFWLKDRPLPREIYLDVKGDAFMVADNGQGIPTRDALAVFEYGFTRKPGGRGLGLYISREALKKVGYSLELDHSDVQHGARFLIGPKPS